MASRLDISLNLSRVEKYPAKQHARRVANMLGGKSGLIYLLGQYEIPREDSDLPPPFVQRKYFYYCTGVDERDCCAIYDIKKDQLVLYLPKIDPKKVIWAPQPPTPAEALNRYDVDTVRYNCQLFDDILHWKHSNEDSTFYILHKDHIPELNELKRWKNVDSEKLQPAMNQCRVIKDEYEIKCISKANEVSAQAHRSVLRNLKNFTGEAEIQGEFERILTNHNTKLAYPTIAGSGENASVLHYMKNNESLKNRQLVCLDAGAEYGYYSSDVTRTFPVSGHFTEEAEKIYSLVQLMQESSIQMLKPGVHMLDLQVHVHKVLTQGFLLAGLFHNGTLDEILKAGTSKGFLPHGLGHQVGLEVHDVLSVPTTRTQKDHCQYPVLVPEAPRSLCRPDQPGLEAGMVITIEPGIYFNHYELNRAYLHDPVHSKYIDQDVLSRYWAVGGVRIEDDILIVDDGYKNLTTAAKGSEMLEIIRAGGGCQAKSVST